jgi:hypothetical protein
MALILNAISATSMFVFGVGIIYILLDSTVGRLAILASKFEWRGLQIKDFVFLLIGIVLILGFTSFYLPY